MAVTVIVPGDALAQACTFQHVFPEGHAEPSQRVDTGVAPDTQPAPLALKAIVALAGVASAYTQMSPLTNRCAGDPKIATLGTSGVGVGVGGGVGVGPTGG